MLGAGRNDHFTTKPGTVWAENLGARYGLSVSPAYTAMPGRRARLSPDRQRQQLCGRHARINVAPPNVAAAVNIPPVRPRSPAFWRAGRSIQARSMRSGRAQRCLCPVRSRRREPATAQTAIATAANDLVAQVARLQAAGARNLIVIGMMDISQDAVWPSPSPADPAQLKASRRRSRPVDGGTGRQEPALFRHRQTDRHHSRQPLGLRFHQHDGSGLRRGQCAAAGARQWLHVRRPQASVHQLAQGGFRLGLFLAGRGEPHGPAVAGGLGRSGAQWRSIDGRLQEFQNFGYQGQGVFVTGDYASSDKDASAGLPSADGAAWQLCARL